MTRDGILLVALGVLELGVIAAVGLGARPLNRVPPSDRDRSASPAAPLSQATVQAPSVREVAVTAHKFAFSPATIEVEAEDLVKITLRTEDIPHSFTIDEYRIAKRAAPGQPAVFEFRADTPGHFVFYCNLSIDEGCRRMRGELVVQPKK